MHTERRAALGELRVAGRTLNGVAMRYGDVSPSHKERFESRSIRMADAVTVNLFHDPERAVAWYPGGGLQLDNGRDALTMRAELPPIPAADRALDEIRAGRIGGLSVEFRSHKEHRDNNGIRVIAQATLSGVGIVRSPSYGQSTVEARARSGRTLRARIPANKKVECRCSGVTCKFAKMMRDGMSRAITKAFTDFERETVAAFGSYDAVLGSTSRNTVRGRLLANGDGEVDIDLPDSAAGAAVIAANEAAGVIVRPVLDDLASKIEPEGRAAGDDLTRVYSDFEIRALIISATDAREGWPEPELVATPGELASKNAARLRQTRRFRKWL